MPSWHFTPDFHPPNQEKPNALIVVRFQAASPSSESPHSGCAARTGGGSGSLASLSEDDEVAITFESYNLANAGIWSDTIKIDGGVHG